MKKNRLDKIIDIITTCEVETQDELITYLMKNGKPDQLCSDILVRSLS